MNQYFIGLSVTYHDPALAIVDEQGEVLFAEATERSLQNKRAINCEPDQLNQIVDLLEQYCSFPCQLTIATNWRNKRSRYEQFSATVGLLSAKGLLRPDFKHLRSPLQNYQLHHMLTCQRSAFVKSGLNLVRQIKQRHPHTQICFVDFDHHLTHAATASFSSPFTSAACAVIDSYGENGSMAFYHYQKGRLKRLHETKGVGSLGFLYMKITELCGFDWMRGEEWKVMGLAAYGKLDPELYTLLKSVMNVEGLDFSQPTSKYFESINKLNVYKKTIDNNFDQAANLAYTGQYVFAELMSQILQNFQRITGETHLTFGGGCALNSSFNGQITQRTEFTQVHIPSAPADDGTALGAAWLACQRNTGLCFTKTPVLSPYSGSLMNLESLQRLSKYNRWLQVEHCPNELCDKVSEMLAAGAIIGWVQGRAEFGPRALGHRSILADPRCATTKNTINDHIKFREYFRPFAPAVLEEYASEFFDNYQAAPYMEKTLVIKEAMRATIAASCHVDGTGRIQSVKHEWNPRFHQLISCFHQITGVPVLLNTSFNVMGKPLVHSFEDALSVFLTTGLHALVVEDYLIIKPNESFILSDSSC